MESLEEHLAGTKGRATPLNIEGATAVIYSEVGFDAGNPLHNIIEFEGRTLHIGDSKMEKSRKTERQIMGILKQHESGMPILDLSRDHGVSMVSNT